MPIKTDVRSHYLQFIVYLVFRLMVSLCYYAPLNHIKFNH